MPQAGRGGRRTAATLEMPTLWAHRLRPARCNPRKRASWAMWETPPGGQPDEGTNDLPADWASWNHVGEGKSVMAISPRPFPDLPQPPELI